MCSLWVWFRNRQFAQRSFCSFSQYMDKTLLWFKHRIDSFVYFIIFDAKIYVLTFSAVLRISSTIYSVVSLGGLRLGENWGEWEWRRLCTFEVDGENELLWDRILIFFICYLFNLKWYHHWKISFWESKMIEKGKFWDQNFTDAIHIIKLLHRSKIFLAFILKFCSKRLLIKFIRKNACKL